MKYIIEVQGSSIFGIKQYDEDDKSIKWTGEVGIITKLKVT